jgi:hypothetical protein
LPPPHGLPSGIADRPAAVEFSYHVDADQAHRFADASDDRDPYTTEAAARAMGCHRYFARHLHSSLRGPGRDRRVRAAAIPSAARFAARLANPVGMVPGQKIVTRFWRNDPTTRAGYFVSSDAAGVPVLTNGRVETA